MYGECTERTDSAANQRQYQRAAQGPQRWQPQAYAVTETGGQSEMIEASGWLQHGVSVYR